jgi:hypothetical protein
MKTKGYLVKFCLLVFLLSLNLPVLAKSSKADSPLFSSDNKLQIRIFGNLNKIIKVRKKKENRVYFPAKISYKKGDGTEVTVDMLMATRGIFRLNPRVCNFPPLMIKFNKQDVKGTLFKGIKKIKLVTHCQNKKKIYQQYLYREYLVYKLYNIFTDESYRVRLARITYEFTGKKGKKITKDGFFIEPNNMLADRNGAKYFKIEEGKGFAMNSDQGSFLSVFQFMIGNTDWAFTGDHNVKRLKPKTGACIAVPYDFDYSGIVNTHYSVPMEKVFSTSTKTRFFQGFCQPLGKFQLIFSRFYKHKPEIYALYKNFPLVSNKYKKKTLQFLDKFYKIISTPRLVKQYILDNCVQKPGKR